MEPPDFAAALRIECSNESAHAVLAAGGSEDHLVFHNERGNRQGVSSVGARATDGNVPHQTTCLCVDRNQPAVDRRHVERVLVDRQSAIHTAAAETRQWRRDIRIRPEHTSRRRIYRDDVVGWLDGVHDAVDDQRRRLELLQRARLEHPLQLEALDVLSRDLRERTVPLPEHVAGVGRPLAGLAADNRGGCNQKHHQCRRSVRLQPDRRSAHSHLLPFSVVR